MWTKRVTIDEACDLVYDGRYAEAYRALRKLVKRHPSDGRVRAFLARASYQLHGDSATVREHLAVAKKDPEHGHHGWMIEGYVLFDRGCREEGLERLREGVRRKRDCPNMASLASHLELVETRESLDEAKGLYLAIIAENPDYEEQGRADARLGSTYAALAALPNNRPEESSELILQAVKWLERALRKSSDDGILHYDLALCYEEIGRQQAAVFHFTKAIELGYDGFAEAHYALAKLLLSMGESVAAADHVDKCLAINNNHPEALELRARLEAK